MASSGDGAPSPPRKTEVAPKVVAAVPPPAAVVSETASEKGVVLAQSPGPSKALNSSLSSSSDEKVLALAAASDSKEEKEVKAEDEPRPPLQPFVPLFNIFQRPPVTWYALDVECVATGPKHTDRAVAQVAVVDQWERVLVNVHVKPRVKVFSYLHALTGLTEKHLESGVSLAEARRFLRSVIPPNSYIVGQGILHDIQWLELREGRDFAGMFDLSGLWRAYNEKYKNYSYFSLEHKAKVLLNMTTGEPHSPVVDSLVSMRLYNMFRYIEHDPAAVKRAHQALIDTPVADSFAKRNPMYDGVCMGFKKACKCGAPFFY